MMNTNCAARRFVFVSIMVVTHALTAPSQTFNSGSTGADGPFNPTSNVTLDLPPNGVFNFTTVNVNGVTVRFNRNTSNTPVIMLATGDVNITNGGFIDVSGSNASKFTGGRGGPGGFDGGSGGANASVPAGAGLGPGGGLPGTCSGCGGGGGGFGAAGLAGYGGAQGGASYGSENLVPLYGGSGGGGGGGDNFNSITGGGGGGGAILIAASGNLNMSDFGIAANGGVSMNNGCNSTGGAGGGGAGGAIRLIATSISGRNWSGLSVSDSRVCSGGGNGAIGRIRVEFLTNNLQNPLPANAVVGRPGPVFIPQLPTLQITSVGGTSVPNSPAGSYITPDLSLPGNTTNPVPVNLAAGNIPLGTTVTVSVVPQYGAPSSAVSSPLAGTLTSSTATANVSLPVGSGSVVVLTAQATFTVQQASLTPTGERIATVRIGTSLGGGEVLKYFTESGKEVAQSPNILQYRRLENSGMAGDR